MIQMVVIGLIALCFGGCTGVMIMALMNAASKADDEMLEGKQYEENH